MTRSPSPVSLWVCEQTSKGKHKRMAQHLGEIVVPERAINITVEGG